MKVPVHHTKKLVYRNEYNVPPYWCPDSYQCWLGSGICDKTGTEIFDGDILDIDYATAQDILGKGTLLAELKVMRLPTAVLVVEFSAARFRLVWRTKNGGVDTGKDLTMLIPVLPAVEVIGHVMEVNV